LISQVFDDDCGSVMQGQTRRQRSREFMASLHELYPEEMKMDLHTRLLVKGVPHDHCLMFQSPEGQRALFGEDYEKVDDAELVGK
jgi:predicted nucleic acid-binding Zn ribbon protein